MQCTCIKSGIEWFLRCIKINTLDEVDFSRYECPLSETKARILFSVINDDVEELKLLTNYPNFFQVADKSGYPILQIAIIMNNVAVFDFLLSLDGCPINARNREGNTALEIALPEVGLFVGRKHNEHFAYSLLKKGAHFRYDGRFLSYALRKNYCKVARFFIENSAELNCCNSYGETPIHLILGLGNNADGVNLSHSYDHLYLDGDLAPIRLTDELCNADEILAMLLCFGANPAVPDSSGWTSINYVFLNKNVSQSILEHFALYVFDDYCTDYDDITIITLDSLFVLLELEFTLSPHPLKCITSINMDEDVICANLEDHFMKLFTIKPENLKLLLEKFDYVIENIIDASLQNHLPMWHYSFSSKMFVENVDLMLQSQFSSDVIQIITTISICTFITEIPENELFETIMILLSYGADICHEDLEKIYGSFGDCEFFRILLHMDIKIWANGNERDIMPGLLYDIHMDIETFLNDPHKYKCSVKDLEDLLNYFAHPKLQDYCYSQVMENEDFPYHSQYFCHSLEMENENIRAKIKKLPTVPLLVELARNETRKLLIEKYKIKNSMQFYTLIKHLPISEVHKKIITLETKLYSNY